MGYKVVKRLQHKVLLRLKKRHIEIAAVAAMVELGR